MVDNTRIKYCFYSGIMFAFGIAFVVASIIRVVIFDENPFYMTGVFIGGIFIGAGLLFFEIKD